LGFALLACAREPAREQARTGELAHAPEAPTADSAAPPMAAAPAKPTTPAARGPAYRVAKRSGGVQVERAPLGVRLDVPADSELSLDLVNGARVELEAGSRGWLLEAEPATVVLVSGSLFAQLPPQGSAAGRPALRVVTAGYAVSIAVNAEVWLARPAANSGRGAARPQYLAVLAGVADLEHLAADPASPIANQQLLAGQAFSGPVPANAISPKGPRTLEQARAAYAQLRTGTRSTTSGAAADPAAQLESALAAWSDAQKRGRTLLEAQRVAKSSGDTVAVQARQSELVALAQEKLAIRQRVRLGYELACERALGQLGDASSDLARFEASFATRVAPALPSGS
jgi:hypothetical protein